MTDENLLSALLSAHVGELPADSRLRTGILELRAALAEPPPHDVFLTVLLRTQGRRLEPLRDALLSLSAQTDRDFEVLVLAHDVEDDLLAALTAIVDEYAPLLPRPAVVIPVRGGRRGTPLNAGFDAARGAYVAVYDDDDVLFANWVEEFHRAAPSAPGRLLRAMTASQRLAPEGWGGGRSGFRTLSWPLAEYEATFDQLRHLLQNRTPFMSIAFPRLMFADLGMRADETLDVCEDWDLILRGAYLLGIHEMHVLTSIYRRWEGGSSSYTTHDEDAWRSSEARVREKLDGVPLVLEPGQVERIRTHVSDEGARDVLNSIFGSLSWRLTGPVRTARAKASAYRHLLRSRRGRNG